MGKITLLREGLPATPGANYVDIVQDSADLRMKAIDSRGLVHVLSKYGGVQNYLYNGDFVLRQRVAAALTNFTGSTTGRVYTADRWGHTTGNATTPQFQQVDTNAAPESNYGPRYYGLFKQLTNAAKICLSQVLIADDCLELRNQRVRLQVKLRKSVGADKTVNLGILQLTSAGTVDTIPATFISAFNGAGVDPTFGTNLSLVTPDADKLDNVTISGSKAQCAITSAWQRFGAVWNLPSNFKNLIIVIFTNDTLAASDDLLVGEVCLYLGQEVMEFGARDSVDELRRCQKFYFKTFPLGTAPVQNGGLGGSLNGQVTVAAAAAQNVTLRCEFPVPMRTTPTMTGFNPSAANANVRNVTGAVDHTVPAFNSTSERGTHISSTGNAAGTVGQAVAFHVTADAEI